MRALVVEDSSTIRRILCQYLIMVTTNSEAEHLGTAMEAGANEYIQKPCTLDMLREKLDLLGLLKT